MNKKVYIFVFNVVINIIIYLLACMFFWGKTIVVLNKIEKHEILNYDIEPVNLDTGLINNEYWGISSDGTNASNTRSGINNAIEYASVNGIKNLKLKKGVYLVSTESDGGYYHGIIFRSGVNLDLNGSIIKLEENSKTSYRIVALKNVNNVSIFNGTIIGDRYEHDYNTINSTHEWGIGCAVLGSNNVSIYNLNICDTTGDGIYISEAAGKIAESVDINNCNIYNCRRQGITIITACEVKINNNEIHDINGIAPQTGIDLEKNNTEQIIKNIFITNNKIYNLASKRGIHIYSFVENVYIDYNEMYDNVSITYINNKGNKTIYIGDNTFLVEKQNSYSNLNSDITNTFSDVNLKKAILELVGKSDENSIYESDIAKIASDGVPGAKQLNLSNKGIEKLDGIEIFAKYNIEWLYLDNNNITDLKPIASFKTLTKLNASNNNIKDISVLENLTNLHTVNLTTNNLTDISILKNMNNLKYVYLNNNRINSLDCLSNIKSLKEVHCAENFVQNIDNILNINDLEILDVRKNEIKIITTSIKNNSLKKLDLSYNKLLDITGLKDNTIDNLIMDNQKIELSTGEVLDTEYVLIGLPQIFSTLDNTYNIELKDMSYYEINNDTNSIKILTQEFINNGLNISVLKNNATYINYSMKIDKSITDMINGSFNVQKTSNYFSVSGKDFRDKNIEDFLEDVKLEDKYTVSFYKNNDIVGSNNVITTGMVMRIYDYEKEFYQDYTLVVYGDTNGDGEITSIDALRIISNKLGSNELNNDICIEAARTTEKTRAEKTIPSAVDALAIVKDKLGMKKIEQ